MLRIDRLTVYHGRVLALSDVSIEVGAGEFVGVIGVNRAGKSTLLQAISGLVALRSGAITFEGEKIDKLAAHRRPELGIAHVPEGRQVFRGLSVAENLVLGSVAPRSRADRASQMAFVYQLFPRLAERRTQAAGTLSGGEQQMLAIGRALMLKPKLLLLDEPSMGLAPIIVDEVYAKVVEIQKAGLAVLLIEQNVPMALSVISRAYVLEHGEVTMSGDASSLKDNPAVKSAFLGI